MRYYNATLDDDFMKTAGLEILVETARLWRSLGHHTEHGDFRIDGITGPDEYSAICDNNVYTNLMASRNLLGAAVAAEKHSDLAAAMDVDSEEIASWRDAARAMVVPFDDLRGVHSQAERFTDHQRWDFQNTPADKYPLLLNYPYFDLYRKQVVKQPDLVLALHFCGDHFTPEQKLRNFDYYEALTVRDSSLSAATEAIVAAEVGHVELAFDYFGEAALMDLEDLEHNVRDGVHMASLAGAWMVPVAGFGGMRDHPAMGLSFTPRLPSRITKLRFRMRYQSQVAGGHARASQRDLRAARRGRADDHRARGRDHAGAGEGGDPAYPGPPCGPATEAAGGPGTDAPRGPDVMTDQSWRAVDEYFSSNLGTEDPVLEGALARSREAGLPSIQVSPNQGRLLWLLARAIGARTVLEVGTLGGYSTIWLARALPPVGRLITLELDPRHAEVARANVAQAHLGGLVEVRVGDAAESLRALHAQGATPFDLIFIDANRAALDTYLELALRLSHPGTLVIADNVVRGGRVADADSGDADAQGIRRFTDLLGSLPHVSGTVVQTVGVKGYDGFALALVTGPAG